MSTYTPSLGLELITPGSQAGLWGNTTNNTFNLIDQAITGVTPISFASASGTTYTLTDFNGAEDEARAAVLNITGTATGSNTVVIPNKQKTYLVRNGTSKDITFQTLAATTPYIVPAGNNTLIFCDGNNGVFPGILVPGAGTLGVNGGGTGKTTFPIAGFVKTPGGTNDFTSAATVSLTSEVSGTLPVSNGGTGASSLINNGILIGKGTGTVDSLVGGTTGYIPTWNGTTWVSAPPASGGVTNVTALSPLNSSGGSTPQISLTGVVSTANGGTGASSLTSAGIVTTGDTQSISGAKTFSSTTFNSTATFNSTVNFNGTTTSSAWNMTSTTSMYYNSGDQNIYWAIGGSTRMKLGPVGNFEITGSLAYKVGGGTWTASSDSRLKDNVAPLSGALSKITSLNPVSYKWKYATEEPTVGFIAQEVANVLPSAVSKSKPSDAQKPFIPDEVYAIGWQNDLFAYLVGAIKELKAEVDALKAAK